MGMSGGSRKGQNTEINITPLVDVVLVLLIIFMVVAPMLAANIPLEIPKQVEEDVPVEMQADNKQVVLQLRNGADGNVVITLNNAPIPKGDLSAKLSSIFKFRKPADKVIFFDANDDVLFGPTVEVMDIVRDLNIKLGVVPNAVTAAR